MSTKRDSVREAALKTRAPRTVLVDFEGEKYEMRAPSVRQATAIRNKATTTDKKGKEDVDGLALTLYAVIACTYVPRTEDEVRANSAPERVFGDEDFDALAEQPQGGNLVEVLAKAALELMAAASPDVAKND